MTVNITRRNPRDPDVEERFVTGLTSLDWAFSDNLGNKGLPLRSIIEVSGAKGVGKSTFMFSMAGLVAKKYHRDALLLDFERQSEHTVSTCLELSGFTGELTWESHSWADDKSKKVAETPEDILNIASERAYETPPPVIMIDSLAAWKPSAIYEGKLGDRNMGVKAFLVRQWFDRTLKPVISNPYPNVIFFTNHKQPIIGAFRPSVNSPIPTESSGGTAVGYLATQSIDVKKLFKYDYPEQGGWVLEGKIAKNRDGFGSESKKNFFVYLQAGEGISRNLTAVIDCVMYKIAKSSSSGVTDSSTITLDGQKVGKFRELIEDRYNDERFLPFHNALKSMSGYKDVEVPEILAPLDLD